MQRANVAVARNCLRSILVPINPYSPQFGANCGYDALN
jgi:hypothetical protein